VRLTDTSVRSLPLPQKGQKTYFDDTLAGFGCRVSQGGTRSFVLQHGDDRQLITIGRYPIISLADARAEARRIVAERTLGKRRPMAMRWDEALESYLAYCAEKNRPSTINGYRRLLARYFDFGSKRLSEISYEELARRLNKLADVPGERNHAITRVKAFLNWALKPPRRYIPYNPLEGVSAIKRPSRKHKLTDDEIVKIYRTASNGTDNFCNIVAMLVLTGQRRGETAGFRRSWLDTKDRLITIPDTVTKNKQQHIFPYGKAVAALLAKIPDTGDYLFPASREHVRGHPTTCFKGWTKSKKTFDKQCGVSGWVLHDLRRNFATQLGGDESFTPSHREVA
jgi:integrase